jgi:hypothetical protein
MSLSERVHDLNRQIGDTVERAIAELRQEIAQRLRAGSEEIQRRLDELAPDLPAAFLSAEEFVSTERELGVNARRDAQRDLRDGLAAIDRARSQAAILTALLQEAVRYASRAAVLLVRGGEVSGWGSEGFGEAAPSIRGLVLDAQDGGWGWLLQGRGALRLSAGDCAGLCSRVESPLPREGVLVPLVLRDRVAAALYADRLNAGELGVEALQILAHAAAQSIETLPFRERASTPSLTLAGEETAGREAGPAVAAPPRGPEDVPAPVQAATAHEPEAVTEPEVEVEAEPETAYPSPEPQVVSGAPWTEEDERSAVAVETEEPAPASGGWEAAAPTYTAELPLAAATETSILTEADVPPPLEPALHALPAEPEPTAPVRIPDISPEATVLLPRPTPLPTEAEPAAAPQQTFRPVPVRDELAATAAVERPSALPSGTPEVRPPSDVEGPGWAFATTRVPVAQYGNEAQHEEAKRLARLLVSEIKLYNEEQVEEGRRNRDIYERLKDDIDRSRQMYDERVDPQILRSTDYFYQELVRILAAGDSKALGI